MGVEGETIDGIADFTFGPVDFTQEKYKIKSLLFRSQQSEVFVNDSVVADRECEIFQGVRRETRQRVDRVF